MGERFWETTSLANMTPEQWESLCDGCGKCCLFKLEDIDTGEVVVCRVACKLLDLNSCQCRDYAQRKTLVPDCTVLTLEHLEEFSWLPSTCAYRLIYEGKPLYDWHPLITGNHQAMHASSHSVRGKVVSELEVHDLHDYLTDWVL